MPPLHTSPRVRRKLIVTILSTAALFDPYHRSYASILNCPCSSNPTQPSDDEPAITIPLLGSAVSWSLSTTCTLRRWHGYASM